jgi:ferredoxin
VWDKHVTRCFSCGTCNLVCPTCYCFDVIDDLDLDVASGSRTRTWDGCMLPHFASVAGGHNFRPEPAGRQRHRVKRKFEYLPGKHGQGAVCVGCGRCGRQCTANIDIYDIVVDLISEGGE